MPLNYNLEDDEDLIPPEEIPYEEEAPSPMMPAPMPPAKGEAMPNVPRDPDDPKEKLKNYFKRQDELAQQSLRGGRQDAEMYRKSNSEIGFGQLLNRAANSFGTLNGKTPPSAGFDQFSQGLKQSNLQELQLAGNERKAAGANEDRKVKMLEYMQRQGYLDQNAADRKKNADDSLALRTREQNWKETHPNDSGKSDRKATADRRVLDQELKDLEGRINPSGARAGSLAKLNDKVNQAEAVEALILDENGNLKKDIDKRQIQELAKGLDNLLTSGVSTVSGVHELVPVSAQGNLQSLQEYITGIPTGGAMDDFVKKLAETVQREKNLRHDQLVRAQVSGLGVAANLRKTNPDEYWTTLGNHKLYKEDFDENGVYIPKAKAPPKAPPGAAPSPPGTVTMKNSAGKVFHIPADKVQAAKSDPDEPLMEVQ